MKIISLANYIDEIGEDNVEKVFSNFCVKNNNDVQNFIRSNAIPFEKTGDARTFLFVSEDNRFLGFVSLALSVMHIPDLCSEKLRKKIKGLKSSSTEVPCYLIGQIARFDGIEKEELRGSQIFEFIFHCVKTARSLFGCRILELDCKDELLKCYRKVGFKSLNKIKDLNQMILFM